MLDLYCWITLLFELCPTEVSISDSVSSVKESVKQLEKLIAKTKQRIDSLASDLKADCTEIFDCEDTLENLMIRLRLERRRLLSVCIDKTAKKLSILAEEIRTDKTQMGADEVRRIALFCKKVLKAIHTQLSAEMPEVDLTVVSRLKAGCVEVLRLIVLKVLESSATLPKHKREEEGRSGEKVLKTTEDILC
jgi:hypothetical protein